MPPGADQAEAVERTACRLTAQLNALPIRQDLGPVAVPVVVIEAGVLLAGQDCHRVGSGLGNSGSEGAPRPVP